MDPGFDMVRGVLGGLAAPLFDACIADLGKRRRHAAFRADSACKTAAGVAAYAAPVPNPEKVKVLTTKAAATNKAF